MEWINIWLLLIFILIVSSAFLMAAETGMMAASRFKLKHLASTGLKRATLVLKILEHPENLLGAILIGNNLVQAALSALITAISIVWFGERGVVYATFIIAALILFFSELIPKSYSSRHPEKVSLWLSWPVYVWLLIFTPIVKCVTFFSNPLLRLMGAGKTTSTPSISEDELKTIIMMGEDEGVVPKEKRRILHRVLEMSELYVREVMIPRTKIKAVELDTPLKKVVALFKNAGFSRMPVYRDTLDNIVGIVHVKDVMSYWDEEKPFTLSQVMRKPFFVPDSAKAERLLEEFRRNKSHIAIVVDEYGGVEGLVTMEDILEEIVGEIQDEHDEEADKVIELTDGSALIDGSATIKEINERLSLNLPEDL
ncbi:MAG: CNNM domain-containing protein, partial [Deltaproteobacteria bacterium]